MLSNKMFSYVNTAADDDDSMDISVNSEPFVVLEPEQDNCKGIPKSKKRKSPKNTHTSKQHQVALKAVLDGMSFKQASKNFQVPQSTILSLVERKIKEPENFSLTGDTSEENVIVCDSEDQPKKRKVIRDTYTQVQIQLALEAVKNGATVYSACKMYGVPRGTMQYRLKNNMTDRMVVRMGPKCALNESQESSVVCLLHSLADAGFNLTHKLFQIFGAEYVRANLTQFPKGNPFPAGIPSRKWVEGFLKRHPGLEKRMSECLTDCSARGWIIYVSRYLGKAGLQTVIQNCRQVFTIDDVGLKRGKSDATFTCLFGANAHGNLLPPLVLYPETIKLPSQRKQSKLIYAVAHQDTELITGNALYQWLSKVFQPWLIEENIPRPVILFIDGSRCQVGYSSSFFCQQHQIVLVPIFPSLVQILRPLRYKLFEEIQYLWHEELQSLDRFKFVSMDPLLKPVLDKLTDTDTIIRDGFLRSKLYPWNPEGYTADDFQPNLEIHPWQPGGNAADDSQPHPEMNPWQPEDPAADDSLPNPEMNPWQPENPAADDSLPHPEMNPWQPEDPAADDSLPHPEINPWQPEDPAADHSQPQPVTISTIQNNAPKPPSRPTVDPLLTQFQKTLESRLTEQQLTEFKAQRHHETWRGPVEHTSLFHLWRELQVEVEAAQLDANLVQEGDGFCTEPEMVTVKLEDTGECLQDFVKVEPSTGCEELNV